MNIFLDISFFTVFIPLLVAHAGLGVTLEMAGGKDNVTEVNEDGYVHISFVLTDNCQPRTDFVRVKVSTMNRGLPTTFCTIVFDKNGCIITDQSLSCHCINNKTMFTSISKKIIPAERIRIEWNDNRSSGGEKNVLLFANGSTTKPNTENMKAPVIVSICCSFVLGLVIGAAIIKVRICKDFVGKYMFMKGTHTRSAVVMDALLLPLSPTLPRQQEYISLGLNLLSQMKAICNQYRKRDDKPQERCRAQAWNIATLVA